MLNQDGIELKGSLKGKPKSKTSLLRQIFKYKTLLAMLSPAIVYVIIFSYIPMSGIILAFKKYNYTLGVFNSPWAGLENFRYLIISDKLWTLSRNTILYNLAFITIGLLFEVGFAIILSEISGRYFKKIGQSSMLLPFFISWVVVSSLMINIFGYEHGVLNNLLLLFGKNPINIYENIGTWPIVMVLLKIWKSTGYGSIIYLAAITGIDQEMYEAAQIDGANIWQRIYNITLPCIVPTMVIMVLLSIGQIFRGDFGMFYQIVKNNQSLLGVSDIIDTFVYRSLISSPDIGMSASAGLYQSVMGLITILGANFAIKKFQPDYALF